jgi:EpsG family
VLRESLRVAENLSEDKRKLAAGWRISGWRMVAAFAISALILLPCWWYRHIQAGDLASHVYNAWLAQLIERGQAPGLYIASQWNNVLFDVALLRVEKLFGFAAAEKIVVSACVLIFFWGVFAFVRTATEQPPWFLTPAIAMLAYGYSFSMGFINYYLSLGLACFGLAVLWRARRFEWIAGALLAVLAWLAHPIGFLWLLGTLAYVRVRAKLPRWWKLALPLAAAGVFAAVRSYAAHRPALLADWDRGPFYLYNGADQLWLYGKRYATLAAAAFFLGLIFVALDFYQRRRETSPWKPFELPLELYLVTFCATALLPENLRPSIYGGWIGLLGSRLTTISAILGLCFLGCLKPRRWHLAAFSVCAAVFFAFLHQDTGWLNRLEANAEKLVEDLPAGTRVVATIDAPPDSRITFIGHAVDRACITHCFSYANYEPASGEFRVRVREDSPVVTSSTDEAEDMASGEYEVDDSDLPLKQIYQCDARDLTKVCIRDLKAGEMNAQTGGTPAAR